MKLTDVVRAPTIWKNFVASSNNTGLKRNLLMDAIAIRYKDPIKERRSEKMMMQVLHEVEEHLWNIEAWITPDAELDKCPRALAMNEMMLLHTVERLECILIMAHSGVIAATTFQRKVRREPPSKDKDLEKMADEAVRDTQRRPLPTTLGSNFPAIVHREARRSDGGMRRPLPAFFPPSRGGLASSPQMRSASTPPFSPTRRNTFSPKRPRGK